MDRNIFRYIESELYNYEATKQLISDIEDDIRNDSGINYETEKTAPTNKIGNPTESKAIRVVSSKRLCHARRVVMAIDRVMCGLDEESLKLVDLRYNKGYHHKKIITLHLPMSEETFRRRKRLIVHRVGMELGLDVGE